MDQERVFWKNVLLALAALQATTLVFLCVKTTGWGESAALYLSIFLFFISGAMYSKVQKTAENVKVHIEYFFNRLSIKEVVFLNIALLFLLVFGKINKNK